MALLVLRPDRNIVSATRSKHRTHR